MSASIDTAEAVAGADAAEDEMAVTELDTAGAEIDGWNGVGVLVAGICWWLQHFCG